MPSRLLIGIDVGGTFTDLTAYDPENGRLYRNKVLTLVDSPENSVINAITPISDFKNIDVIIHATTLCTNMLLGQTGLEKPKVALITTKGFRDVLEIGRQRRPELYNLFFTKPEPLVPRSERFEISERIGPNGQVIRELDLEEARRLARRLCRERYEVVAVSLLHSYANPSHEEMLEEIIKEECPGITVVLSSKIDPRRKEYERTSTTVVNAILKPMLARYLSELRRQLQIHGFEGKFLIMQSNGGVAKMETAIEKPAFFIESGPAAGAIAVAHYSRLIGEEKVLGFDMGGTTAKASTIINGEPEVTTEYEVGGKVHSGRIVKGSGYPVRTSFIDLAEVSAGGGTIAWVDDVGTLRIGPFSAGAIPGPACYNKGGDKPTVTDAHLILGRLGEKLANNMLIYKSLAEKVYKRIAEKVGLNVEETAYGVIKLANTVMGKALRIVSVERGHDPREMSLIAFGGAGPLHAVELGRELGVKRVIIPVFPGTFSALGLLLSNYKSEKWEGVYKLVTGISEGELEEIFSKLEREAFREIDIENVDYRVLRVLEMRYPRQAYELQVPWDRTLEGTVSSFYKLHEKRYGFYTVEEPVEISTVRVIVIGEVEKPDLKKAYRIRGSPVPREYRKVYIEGEWVGTPVYVRDNLPVGFNTDGPVVVEDYDSTIYVPPDTEVLVDENYSVVVMV